MVYAQDAARAVARACDLFGGCFVAVEADADVVVPDAPHTCMVVDADIAGCDSGGLVVTLAAYRALRPGGTYVQGFAGGETEVPSEDPMASDAERLVYLGAHGWEGVRCAESLRGAYARLKDTGHTGFVLRAVVSDGDDNVFGVFEKPPNVATVWHVESCAAHQDTRGVSAEDFVAAIRAHIAHE